MLAFKSLDRDGNGTLTKDEVMQGYVKVFGQPTADIEKEVERLFHAVDSNKSGNIDFSEFLVAAAAEYKNLSKKRVEQTFKLFDQDSDGYIDRKELTHVLGALEMNDEDWREMIADIDKDGDGKVDESDDRSRYRSSRISCAVRSSQPLKLIILVLTLAALLLRTLLLRSAVLDALAHLWILCFASFR
jgi:Ca2+-binding EF-hand superfamily protein